MIATQILLTLYTSTFMVQMNLGSYIWLNNIKNTIRKFP